MKNVKNNKINNNKRSRRGVIDAQFNWIFVMIAGFVIFLFIIGIVLSQKSAADKQTSITVINQITALLKGKQQTSDIYSEITFPRTEVTFRCDPDDGTFNFRIGNSVTNQLPVEIIFAPQSTSTNKLMVWSQAFMTGFPVGAFTYITTADSIILIFNNSEDNRNEYAEDLFADLPSNITHKYITSLSDYSSFKKRRIVCFEGYCPGNFGTGTADADYLKISPGQGSGLYDYGNVTFHKKGSNGAATNSVMPYVSKAGLYGAIFSDSRDYYTCQMSRAMKQFEIERSIVERRLFLIQNNLGEGECRTTINSTLDYQIIPMNSDTKLKWSNITDLNYNIKALDLRNINLGFNSCGPGIY